MSKPRFEFHSLATGPRRDLTAEEFAELLRRERARTLARRRAEAALEPAESSKP